MKNKLIFLQKTKNRFWFLVPPTAVIVLLACIAFSCLVTGNELKEQNKILLLEIYCAAALTLMVNLCLILTSDFFEDKRKFDEKYGNVHG